MGKEKRAAPVVAVGSSKERKNKSQRSQYDSSAPVPEGLEAKRAMPKSKHHSYFEFVENEGKKKKLEYQVTRKRDPPPGFEFVPIGNPELTQRCKEISREKDAMIFIVSDHKSEIGSLSQHMSRTGHHVRETIVQEARAQLPHLPQSPQPLSKGPEPLPDSQAEYHVQVDAAIRDLFPRIPNTDRQDIIDHSFTQGRSLIKGETPVGLCDDITLARRVQLAVLAHIRHAHTRYDDLLKETTWSIARKAVESLCLDTLVKWRGDEENGRDQLDEILREVVIISDSEDDSSDEESSDDTSLEGDRSEQGQAMATAQHHYLQQPAMPLNVPGGSVPVRAPPRHYKTVTAKDAEKKRQRGFKRYQAWEDALLRNRVETTTQYYDSGVGSSHLVSGIPVSQASMVSANPSVTRPSQPGRIEVRPQNQPPSSRSHALQDVQRTSLDYPRADRDDYDPTAPQLVHSRSISPPVDQFKDMLVRSIEPSSPGTQPSFIRTVTARHMIRAGSPPRRPHARKYHSRPSSPHRDAYQEQPPPAPIPDTAGGVPILVGQRAVRFVPPRGREHVQPPMAGSPITGSERRGRPGVYPPDHPIPPRRVLVEGGPAPAMRSSPVFMEDRGGFFERVSGPVEQRIQEPHDMFRTRRVVSAVDDQRMEGVIQTGHGRGYGEPARHASDQYHGHRHDQHSSYHEERSAHTQHYDYAPPDARGGPVRRPANPDEVIYID